MSLPRGRTDDASSSAATSRGLVEAARHRDPAAWSRMVALYAPLVLAWCRQWGLREDDAADVFQDVFHAVAAHLADFRRDRTGDTFRGWLRTITRNKVRDAFRRRRREPPGVGGSAAQSFLSLLPDPVPPDDDESSDLAISALVRRGLALIQGEFEPRTWQAFWQTAVDGRAAADVAEVLGMSAGAVRVAKSRVLHRLRAVLGDRAG